MGKIEEALGKVPMWRKGFGDQIVEQCDALLLKWIVTKWSTLEGSDETVAAASLDELRRFSKLTREGSLLWTQHVEFNALCSEVGEAMGKTDLSSRRLALTQNVDAMLGPQRGSRPVIILDSISDHDQITKIKQSCENIKGSGFVGEKTDEGKRLVDIIHVLIDALCVEPVSDNAELAQQCASQVAAVRMQDDPFQLDIESVRLLIDVQRIDSKLAHMKADLANLVADDRLVELVHEVDFCQKKLQAHISDPSKHKIKTLVHKCTCVCEEVAAFVGEVFVQLQESDRLKLERSMDALRPFAGGTLDGTHWSQDFLPDPITPFESIIARMQRFAVDLSWVKVMSLVDDCKQVDEGGGCKFVG
jgi:hypothetical protein